MGAGLRILSVSLMLCTIAACGPSRPPIPVGEIPTPPLVSRSDEEYGRNVLMTLTRTYPVEQNRAALNRVLDVVYRLADASGTGNDPWHIYILRGDSVMNAAATRGNYVFVWSGLLRQIDSDSELATVLGHELGHVLAGHTQSTPQEEAASIIAQASGGVVGSMISSQGPYGAAAGIAGSVVSEAVKAFIVNPESQRLELEADQIGLFLMADAGYNPVRAVEFWERFGEKLGHAPSAAQFLSSHPSHEARITRLKALLPEAMQRYYDALHDRGREFVVSR